MTSPILLYDLCGADEALRFSPHCWKAKLSLAHKGLAFQTVPTPFTKVPEIGGGAFTKTVPVIDDGGKLVRDSFAIATYLDETYPERPALFAPRGRVAARFVEGVIQKRMSPLISRMIVLDIHDRLAPADQAYFRKSRETWFGPLEDYQVSPESLASEFAAALDPLRRALREGPWLGGEGPLFADYIVAGALMWLRTIKGAVPLADTDTVADWFERVLDLHDGLARNAGIAA